MKHFEKTFYADQQNGRYDAFATVPRKKPVSRFSGPGAFYNAGNLLAITSGVVLHLFFVEGDLHVFREAYIYLAGTSEALWWTISILMFIVAGEIYHQAYRSVPVPSRFLIAMGDLMSGLAAIVLTVALVQYGETALALLAGIMLAWGKIGSAAAMALGGRLEKQLEGTLRFMVVASRVPSILSLFWSILMIVLNGQPLVDITLPAFLIVCFLLWFRADLLLMRN